MKSIVYLSVCFLCILIEARIVVAQDSVSVHEKYFRYRNRLNYFMVFSDEPGGGLLANIRNRDAWKDPDGIDASGDEIDYHQSISFGQTHTRTGYLLGTLSTEYALLKQAGDIIAADKTLAQIRIVLNAFKRTDLCESAPPWFLKDTLDGFFVREDVSPILSGRLYNQLNFSLNENDYFGNRALRGEFGIPALIDSNSIECLRMYEHNNAYFFNKREAKHPDFVSFENKNTDYYKYYKDQKFISQDEVLGALVGLCLTYKFVDDEFIRKDALNHILLMINFMCGSKKTLWWRPLFPDGTRMGNENGADGRAYAYAMKSIAYNYAGQEYLKNHFPDILKAPWCRDAYEGAEIACLSGIGVAEYRIFRFLMAESISLSGASRISKNVPFLLKSFTSIYDWDTFFLLLHAALNDLKINKKTYDFKKLSIQLSQVPANGTWQYGDKKYPKNIGWSAEFKWSATIDMQNGKTNENWSLGNFSGIDFMLLHNLACLLIDEYKTGFNHYLEHK